MQNFLFDPVSNYLTIPYKKQSASFDGCDCWGLIRLIYAEELGVELPDFTAFAVSSDTELFEQVDNLQKYDILLIVNGGDTINHCGIYMGKGDFIHALDGNGVVISKLSRWLPRIISYHRYNNAY